MKCGICDIAAVDTPEREIVAFSALTYCDFWHFLCGTVVRPFSELGRDHHIKEGLSVSIDMSRSRFLWTVRNRADNRFEAGPKPITRAVAILSDRRSWGRTTYKYRDFFVLRIHVMA